MILVVEQMKLKTLKDISKNMTLPNGYVLLDYSLNKDLRQEAIKWIKSIHKLAMDNLDSPLPMYFEEMVFNKDTIFGARIILMKIFNITEEELK